MSKVLTINHHGYHSSTRSKENTNPSKYVSPCEWLLKNGENIYEVQNTTKKYKLEQLLNIIMSSEYIVYPIFWIFQ